MKDIRDLKDLTILDGLVCRVAATGEQAAGVCNATCALANLAAHPKTLHPAPCTLHPEPYTLHRKPQTLTPKH